MGIIDIGDIGELLGPLFSFFYVCLFVLLGLIFYSYIAAVRIIEVWLNQLLLEALKEFDKCDCW